MDEETKVRSDSTPKALVQEEFVSMQAICTVTAEVDHHQFFTVLGAKMPS